MTEGFKITTWMTGWTEKDHAAYREAWTAATQSDPYKDSGACSRDWLRRVMLAAEDDETGAWARDVLADMQRRGALESWKAATIKGVVVRKGRHLPVVAATVVRDEDGEREMFVQTELFDMSRDDLVRQVNVNKGRALTYHAKSALAKRLVALVDAAIEAGADPNVTPRQAAKFQGVDLAEWCAA